MALLVGRHLNRIDKKGRVSVPKPFRDAFAGQEFAGLYAYPLFKFSAVEACDHTFMTRLSASLDGLDMFSDEQDDLAAVILEGSHALPFDPEGRIALPSELVAHAALKDEVLFVGRGGRMQMWHPAWYEQHRRDALLRAKSRGATLRLNPEAGDAT